MSWTENLDEDLANAVFKVQVKLPSGQVVDRNFKADFDINYDMLEEQLAETPAQLAFFSAVLAEQRFTVKKLERMIARRRAVIAQDANETAKTEGLKLHKYVIDEVVEVDNEIFELQAKLMLEERTLSKLYGFVDSLKGKMESLRSLAGFKRQEMRDA